MRDDRGEFMATGSFAAGDYINHRYQVVQRLGAGAMGTVYLAEDLVRVQRRVALKILKSETLEDTEVWSKGEYEALTRLRHPNLARVHDFGRISDSNDFYIVSEYIRGQDLFSATREMDEEELHDVIAQICRALEYIHTQGYVHFDIKPDNILVTRDRSVGSDDSSKVQWSPDAPKSSDKGSGPPRVKLIDFGLAEQLSGTFDFAIKGTLNYVAPEIIQGRNPDKRADLFSLGVTLFQILTAKLPFVGEDGGTVSRERTNWREDVRRQLSSQPDYMVDILVRLLEDQPERRFASAREIIQTLNAGAGRHYQIETAETQVSYLYCSRLVGRRTELNRLKEEAETIFQAAVYQQKDGGGKSSGDTSVVSRILRDESRKRPPLALISGEIGIGKSRLFEEFAHFLKMREIPVHIGNSYETAHDPYQPFREIIEQMALSNGLESDIFQKHKDAVTRLCPKLRSSDVDEEDETGFRPDKERLYFIDSLASFIVEAAGVRPCVINLNNLHWADEASVELLNHLVKTIADADSQLPCDLPLMVFATMRSDESLPEGLRNTLTELREDQRIQEIQLRRFNRAQIAELMHHMLSVEEIPRGFLDRLEERTSGNPLFIVEILKVLQEEGIIARDGDSWKIRQGTDLVRVEMPQGIEAILLRRVKVLEAPRRAILQWMAVYDKPVSIRLLGRMPGVAETGLRRSLSELENRGMVMKVIDGGKPLFTISQPKLREIVYEDLTDVRRRELHGDLAEALVHEYEGHEDEILEDLANHYQLSDRAGKALEYTIRAGDALRKIFGHKRAIDHYRHALRQIEGAKEHVRTWFELHEKIGDIATTAGDYETAQQSYELLLDLEDSGELELRDRARVLRKKGKLEEIQGEYAKALRGYKEASDLLSDAESDEDRSERVRVHSCLAWINVCLGQYEKAMKISADALRFAEGLDEQSEHAMIFTTIGSANFFRGQLEAAIEFHTRALEIRERLENAPEIIISLNNLGEAYMASGEYMEALKHFNQACSAAEEVGDAFGRAMAQHRLAEVHLRLGENEQSEQFLRDSLKLSRDYRMRFLTTRNHLLRGRLNKELDQLSKAEGDLFRALGVFARQGSRLNVAECLLEIAEIHSVRGDYEQALNLIQEAIGNAVALNVAGLEARARLLGVRIEREAGAAEPAELLDKLKLIGRILEGTSNTELLAAVQLEYAEIHVQGRNLDEARSCYRAAEDHLREIVERLPHRYRENYLSLHHVSGGGAVDGMVAVREVASEPEMHGELTSEHPKTQVVRKTDEGTRWLPPQERKLLRIATLLQDLGGEGNVRTLLPKVLNCMIQDTGSESGCLLMRKGDEVRVLGAFTKRGEPIKSPADIICLEALELAWDSSEPILAPRVVDDPRIGKYEALYRSSVTSLAVLPMRIDSNQKAAVYLTNPQPDQLTVPLGGPVMLAYQNLVMLLVPQVIQAQRASTVR